MLGNGKPKEGAVATISPISCIYSRNLAQHYTVRVASFLELRDCRREVVPCLLICSPQEGAFLDKSLHRVAKWTISSQRALGNGRIIEGSSIIKGHCQEPPPVASAARGIWFASCRQRIKLMEEISHWQGRNVNSLQYFLAFVHCCVKEKAIYRFFFSFLFL